ncbi:MAG: hypothetical protein QM487_13290 [Candidatus Marithrix sp.]
MLKNQYLSLKYVSILLFLFTMSPQLLAEEADGVICGDVITYAKDPTTEKWKVFPNSCTPEGWEATAIKPDDFDSQNKIQPESINNVEDICAEVIAYAKNPKTDHWYEFSTPCDVPDGWENTLVKPESLDTNKVDDDSTKVCAEVITYAKNTDTAKWYVFSTPCDVPDNWEISLINNFSCENAKIDVEIYAKNMLTGNSYILPTPCDVPQEWSTSFTKFEESNTNCTDNTQAYFMSPLTENWYSFPECDAPNEWLKTIHRPDKVINPDATCINNIIYAKNPTTKNWYAFTNSCDVPTGWDSSVKLPSEFADGSCSTFHATYYSIDGKVNIPYVYFSDENINAGEQQIYKEIELEAVSPQFNPPLFFLKNISEIK